MSRDGEESLPQVVRQRFLEVGALALAGVLGLAATAYVALRTSRGLRLDQEATDAVSSPQVALYRLHEGLGWVTVGSVGLSLLACVAVDLVTRPDLGLGPNSLPSGHTTVALSIALAAVIVVPSAWRPTIAMGVCAVATLVGVATVLGRWHRPSDVVAATFVCVVWAALG